jgi:DNA polymerase III epsilon subunit-like protein
MREIVLDTETTGLDPLDGHRIVEIGALELINRSPTGHTFHCYVHVPQSAGLHVRGPPRADDHDPVEGAGGMRNHG